MGCVWRFWSAFRTRIRFNALAISSKYDKEKNLLGDCNYFNTDDRTFKDVFWILYSAKDTDPIKARNARERTIELFQSTLILCFDCSLCSLDSVYTF